MITRPYLAAAVAVLALGAGVAGGRDGSPQVDDVRCLRGCAGPRTVAVDSAVRFEGRHLGGVNEIRFAGENGAVATAPLAASPRAVKAEVPAGAVTGRPRLVRHDSGMARSPVAVRIVGAGALPEPRSFELERARMHPGNAYFDDRRPLRLSYRFAGHGPLELRLQLVKRGEGKAARRGKVIRTLRVGRTVPYSTHSRRWNGLNGARGVPPDGRYAVRVEAAGGGRERGANFRFHGHRFPVHGPHSYGDRFGAPRSGGRVHEGQDLPSPCGTELVAARGGRVRRRGFDYRLYGYFVLIDGRETKADHFYAHMRGPTPLADGERVRTGQRIGAVGKTGNARGEFCQLHFELWPDGYRRGPPADPLPSLRRWDRWS